MANFANDLPEKTGVYFFFNKKGDIIYIGKAINLKKRIRDHFRELPNKYFKKAKLKRGDNEPLAITTWDYQLKYLDDIQRIIYDKEKKRKVKVLSDTFLIKYILTENEEEALTLEGSLISAFRPELNRMFWKYPFIEITLGEEIPRILTGYQVLLPDSYIFGPFNIASNIDLAMDAFLTVVPICNHYAPVKIGGKYPTSCLREQISRCLAPCKNSDLDFNQYNHFIKYFISELERNGKGIINKLELLMKNEIHNENFEAAIVLRDKINAVKFFFSSKVMSSIIKKYYPEIMKIVDEKDDYKKIIDKLLKNNGY